MSNSRPLWRGLEAPTLADAQVMVSAVSYHLHRTGRYQQLSNGRCDTAFEQCPCIEVVKKGSNWLTYAKKMQEEKVRMKPPPSSSLESVSHAHHILQQRLVHVAIPSPCRL